MPHVRGIDAAARRRDQRLQWLPVAWKQQQWRHLPRRQHLAGAATHTAAERAAPAGVGAEVSRHEQVIERLDRIVDLLLPVSKWPLTQRAAANAAVAQSAEDELWRLCTSRCCSKGPLLRCIAPAADEPKAVEAAASAASAAIEPKANDASAAEDPHDDASAPAADEPTPDEAAASPSNDTTAVEAATLAADEPKAEETPASAAKVAAAEAAAADAAATQGIHLDYALEVFSAWCTTSAAASAAAASTADDARQLGNEPMQRGRHDEAVAAYTEGVALEFSQGILWRPVLSVSVASVAAAPAADDPNVVEAAAPAADELHADEAAVSAADEPKVDEASAAAEPHVDDAYDKPWSNGLEQLLLIYPDAGYRTLYAMLKQKHNVSLKKVQGYATQWRGLFSQGRLIYRAGSYEAARDEAVAAKAEEEAADANAVEEPAAAAVDAALVVDASTPAAEGPTADEAAAERAARRDERFAKAPEGQGKTAVAVVIQRSVIAAVAAADAASVGLAATYAATAAALPKPRAGCDVDITWLRAGSVDGHVSGRLHVQRSCFLFLGKKRLQRPDFNGTLNLQTALPELHGASVRLHFVNDLSCIFKLQGVYEAETLRDECAAAYDKYRSRDSIGTGAGTV